MFVSAHSLIETPISASPMQAFIDKAKALGRPALAYTDIGYMSGGLKFYKMVKDAGLNFIPGIDMMFLDKDCLSHKTCPEASYFTLTAYAHDKESYHALATVSSAHRSNFITKNEDSFPLYNWKDLEYLSKHNVSFVLHGSLSLYARVYFKNKEAAKDVAQRLVSLKRPVYVSLIAGDEKDKWSEKVTITTKNGTADFDFSVKVDTDKAINIPVKDIAATRHTQILAIYKNGIRIPSKVPMDILDKKIAYKASSFSKNYVKEANLCHLSLAKSMGLKVLSSDYATMANQDEKNVQMVRLEGKKLSGTYYMMSERDYVEKLQEHGILIQDIENSIKNTLEWASSFNVKLDYQWQLPQTANPEQEMIRIFKKNGRFEKFKDNQVYMDRLKRELGVIRKNGVIDLIHYFFPIVSYADFLYDNNELLGPSRGSAAGSLLAYFMGIHNINPIKYNLPFERFFSMDRILTKKLPDIDTDAGAKTLLLGADSNSGWLYGTYGDKAAQISTRQNIRLKSAIKDANRVKNNGDVEPMILAFAENLPNAPQGTSDADFVFGYKDKEGTVHLGLLQTNEKLKKYTEDRPDEWDIVKRSFGIPRSMGRHASAVVIADVPISTVVPTMQVGDNKRVTQYEAKDCEAAGLIKYDFLGVSQLDDINLCLKLINKKNGDSYGPGVFKHEGKETHIWELPENDEKTAKLIETDDLISLFQIGTQTARPLAKAIKPRNVEDHAVILALGRPGPLDFKDEKTGRNMAEEYIERRHGRSSGEIQILNDVLSETFGVIVYQEQLTKVAKDIGGMDGERAEILRDNMCKKRMKALDAMKPEFMEGAVKKAGQEVATQIWDMMVKFGNYGFSLNHAIGYATTTYATAFLKAHYPLEWWTAVLTNSDQKEIMEKFWKSVRHLIAPPDINISTDQMTIDYEKGLIRSKLSIVKGLSDDTARKIVESRPFNNVEEFVKKDAVKPALTRKLIQVGVMDSLFPSFYTIEMKLQDLEDALEKIKYEKALAQGKKKAILKKGSIDPEFLAMSPIEFFKLKKDILPSMPIDLTALIADINPRVIKQGGRPMVPYGKSVIHLMNGKLAETVDKASLKDRIKYAVASYIVDAKEFTYAKGTKKALKLIVDTDGYSREMVKWPDYNTGELEYPSDLKKGSVAIIILERRPEKDPSIQEIVLQS